MVKRIAFNLYVSCNMLVCSVVFAPWALPRETVSGILGRWMTTESGRRLRVGIALGRAVDLIYFWEKNHCVEVFRLEAQSREILYP